MGQALEGRDPFERALGQARTGFVFRRSSPHWPRRRATAAESASVQSGTRTRSRGLIDRCEGASVADVQRDRPGRRRQDHGCHRRSSKRARAARPASAKGIKRQFTSVNGVSAEPDRRPDRPPGLEAAGSLAITPRLPVSLPAVSRTSSGGHSCRRRDFWSTGTGSRAERPDDRCRGLAASRPVAPTSEAGSSRRSNMTNLAAELRRRRPRARHLRGRDRSGLADRLRRRSARLEARLDRRHGRPGHGDDARRHRRRRLDPSEQGIQHPRRQLLAPVVPADQLHVRPAGQGRRAALALGRRRRRGGRQLRRRAVSRAACRSRPATIRS